jgi:hypothetical protein
LAMLPLKPLAGVMVVFSNNLRELQRANSPWLWKAFVSDLAQENSSLALTLLVAMSLIMAEPGLSILSEGTNLVLGILSLLFPTFLVCVFGYALYLKRSNPP